MTFATSDSRRSAFAAVSARPAAACVCAVPIANGIAVAIALRSKSTASTTTLSPAKASSMSSTGCFPPQGKGPGRPPTLRACATSSRLVSCQGSCPHGFPRSRRFTSTSQVVATIQNALPQGCSAHCKQTFFNNKMPPGRLFRYDSLIAENLKSPTVEHEITDHLMSIRGSLPQREVDTLGERSPKNISEPLVTGRVADNVDVAASQRYAKRRSTNDAPIEDVRLRGHLSRHPRSLAEIHRRVPERHSS
ncbi:hypothetical protein ACVWWD_005734 [Mesorhizobium sp. URHB0026]